MGRLLDVHDLKTSFFSGAGETRAVDGVSFSVEPGTVLGLVGESGAGKTVTALSIMGLLPDSARILSGSIRLDGTELVGAPEATVRAVRGSRVAMIFQDPLASFNPVYTIGEQIGEALRLDAHAGTSIRQDVEQLLELAELADPSVVARAYPHQLSGGMRQRAMIAMALARQPGLLIADEPTTALDVTVQAQITDLLARLQRERRMAMILITHDLGVVASIADRVAVMLAGRLVEVGSVNDIFTRPEHGYTRELLAAVPRVGVR